MPENSQSLDLRRAAKREWLQLYRAARNAACDRANVLEIASESALSERDTCGEIADVVSQAKADAQSAALHAKIATEAFARLAKIGIEARACEHSSSDFILSLWTAGSRWERDASAWATEARREAEQLEHRKRTFLAVANATFDMKGFVPVKSVHDYLGITPERAEQARIEAGVEPWPDLPCTCIGIGVGEDGECLRCGCDATHRTEAEAPAPAALTIEQMSTLTELVPWIDWMQPVSGLIADGRLTLKSLIAKVIDSVREAEVAVRGGR